MNQPSEEAVDRLSPKMQEQWRDYQTYLMTNPGATVTRCCEALGIQPHNIYEARRRLGLAKSIGPRRAGALLAVAEEEDEEEVADTEITAKDALYAIISALEPLPKSVQNRILNSAMVMLDIDLDGGK